MTTNATQKQNLSLLERTAAQLRLHVVQMVAPTGQGYVQQGLGAADIFTAVWFGTARINTEDPDWPDRDRVYLSTAHNTALLYATLAERGFFNVSRLTEYCSDGSPLEINGSERMGTMVEATCGSLGQGLSVAVGTAAALKRRGSSARVYLILGDGELQEGQVWEAAMTAGCWALDNLCLIIDYNKLQVEGEISKVLSPEPLTDKMEAFGFATQSLDGNDLGALLDALDRARATKGRPSCLVANTIPGKGVDALEGTMAHMLRFPPDVAAQAIAELKEKLDQ